MGERAGRGFQSPPRAIGATTSRHHDGKPARSGESVTRDRELELQFLARTSPSFRARVIARLDRAGAELGRDLPTHCAPDELVFEAREECEDIAGWALMALQVAATQLPEHELAVLRTALTGAVVLAHAADVLLEGLEQ